MPALAEVLLGNLQLDRLVGVLQRAEQRRRRLAHLEVDRPVLDLDDDVVVEAAVEADEVVVGGARAIVLQVAPVHLVVVDEPAIEEHAAVRLERPRDDVGRIGMGPLVGGGADPPFRIRLEHDAAEIRHGAIDLVDLRLPPLDHTRIERIVGRELADLLRAGEIDRDGDLHAPRPQHVGDPGDLRQELRRQEDRVGVDVGDRDAVDAERGEQPAVVVDEAEILADLAALPEDRPPAVAALDRAVDVVPVIQPADRRLRRAAVVDLRRHLAERQPAQIGKRAVEHAAVVVAGDHRVGGGRRASRSRWRSRRARARVRSRRGHPPRAAARRCRARSRSQRGWPPPA